MIHDKHDKAIPPGYMTVGEVAKKMGVTVRALQYYDRQGLLSPSAESAGGRRLYADKDLIRLHQILSLKHLGFSLDDIKNRLSSLNTPADVAQALSEQAAAVQEKIEVLSESLREIESLLMEVGKFDGLDNEWKQKQTAANAFIEPALSVYFTNLGVNPFEEGPN